MRAVSAAPARESGDFNPAGTRAERVQTVNGSVKWPCNEAFLPAPELFRKPARSPGEAGGMLLGAARYFCFSAVRVRSSTLMRRSAAENVRSASASAGHTTSLASAEFGSGTSSSSA
jgi:hypothetical protein